MRSLIIATAAAVTALAGTPARAESYTLLIYETPADLRLRDDNGAAAKDYWASYASFGRTLAEAGVLRGGAALMVPAKVTTVTLGGYFTLETASRAEAERFATRAPAIKRGGRVELRANLPTMAPAS